MGLLKFIILFFVVSNFAGCSSLVRTTENMQLADKAYYQPDASHAVVIFEREDTSAAHLYAMSLWDITGYKADKSEPEFIGVLERGMRTAWRVKPGDYYFMLVMIGWRHVMQAKVEAGKTYYVFLNVTLFSGHSFVPIKKGKENPVQAEFVTLPTAQGIQWSRRKTTQDSVKSHAPSAITDWQGMSEQEQQALTLLPEDGR